MTNEIENDLSLLDESLSCEDDLRQRIVFFKPDQQQLVFEGYIYNRMGKECNLDSTWRWRCSNCYGCSLKTIGNYIDKRKNITLMTLLS